MIYLDNNATTALDSRVAAQMRGYLEDTSGPCNPSSVHAAGREARGAFERARRALAEALGAEPLGITFTGSGTESINLALVGRCRAARARGLPSALLTTRMEHAAVLESAALLAREGHAVHWIDVDGRGAVDASAVAAQLRAHEDVGVVSVGMVNSELGNLCDIKSLGAAVKATRKDVLVHTDAVQALGKVPLHFEDLGVDMMSVTAHKLHGPVGIAALVHTRGLELDPVLRGGGQERGRRPGTPSVMLAEAFALAASLAAGEVEARRAHTSELRRRLVEVLTEHGGTVLGAPALQVGNTASVRFPGCEGATLAMALDLEGVCVSTGSACSSGVAKASATMRAIGLSDREGQEVIRVSLGKDNTREELDRFGAILGPVLSRIREGAVAMGGAR
ncbi:MAG: cysteine desulfurase family protein [Nannocystaceae bacterium]